MCATVSSRNNQRHAPKAHVKTSASSNLLPVINIAPDQVLTIIPFANDEAGEMGPGPGVTEAARPRMSLFLDPNDASKLHVVQLTVSWESSLICAGAGGHSSIVAASTELANGG